VYRPHFSGSLQPSLSFIFGLLRPRQRYIRQPSLTVVNDRLDQRWFAANPKKQPTAEQALAMAELRVKRKKVQRRAIPERKKPVTKTTFSGNRLCFSLWLCRSLNFPALRPMTRLFQPNGLFDQVSGKKKRPATKFCVLVAWQPARFLGNRCSVGVMICSNTGLAAES
jgi:hypothetical protein